MKQAHRYFIRQYSQQQYMHGGIGYVDAERILEAEQYEPVYFPAQDDFSFRAKLRRFCYLWRMGWKIKKGDTLVFLYPVYATMNKWLIRILTTKGVKQICFIADINGLKDADSAQLQRDIRFFRHQQYFILHNEHMKQWLDSVAPGKTTACIEFFDFLANNLTVVNTFSFDIVFAGNLEKSRFLEKLYLLQSSCPSVRFQLYGPGQTAAMINQPNAAWHGLETPYELPLKLKGGFGLLWDGESIGAPGGSLGDYMQYISHHKLSLYIISRLPLIVPASAASAYLVTKYKIGITINSLYELEEKIKGISAHDYQQMQHNMSRLSQKISRGGCLREALDRLMEL